MSDRPGPIHEAVNHIEAAFLLIGRCIQTGLRATRQDYALSAPRGPAEPSSPASTPTEATGGAREAQEG